MIRSSSQQLLCLLLGLLLLANNASGQTSDSRTVIGPSNLPLKEGADALLAGDAEEGVRLSLQGLRIASSLRERHAAWGNLCAGYAMLGQYETALDYCDRVLAENDQNWRAYSNRAFIYVQLERYDEAEQDLVRGEAIAPKSRNLKTVRAMLLDKTEPVAPTIVIDDRRQPADSDNDQ